MDLLPKMRSEDLNQRNLEGRNFTMHENAGEIQLHLETDIDVSTIDGWRPPQCETTIWDLGKTRPLGVGQFFAII